MGNSAGFTLIELLVVFSTLAVLAIIGFASFVSYSRTQALNQSAFDVVTMLNLAKSRASTQIKPTDGSFCDQNATNHLALEGYMVYIVSETTYELEIQCEGQIVAISNQIKTLSNGTNTSSAHNIVFSSSTIGKTFLFKVLEGGVSFRTPGAVTDSIEIFGFSNTCKKITINVGGKMDITDGTVQNSACST